MADENEYTPGPWKAERGNRGAAHPLFVTAPNKGSFLPWNDADALLIAAAPDLLEAAKLLEHAEDIHANCDDCEGESVPELCGTCFPYFDDARIKRRKAIDKAEGRA